MPDERQPAVRRFQAQRLAVAVAMGGTLSASLAACDPNSSDATAANASTYLAETVAFPNGALHLHGLLYKPKGPGPFPAIFYNHGSAPGLLNNQAFDAIAPIFVARGWVFFAPYRRGQGLSEAAGPYIMDEIAAARSRGGLDAGQETMTRLLATDHLSDQLAALAWLRTQPNIRPDAIAVMGNSFGGIETLLGASRGGYCAVVDAAGGAESWDGAPSLRKVLVDAVSATRTPILFFQAENDYSLAPSQTLSAERQRSALPTELHIYPPFGSSHSDGHSFAYRGVPIWRDDVVRFVEKHCIH